MTMTAENRPPFAFANLTYGPDAFDETKAAEKARLAREREERLAMTPPFSNMRRLDGRTADGSTRWVYTAPEKREDGPTRLERPLYVYRGTASPTIVPGVGLVWHGQKFHTDAWPTDPDWKPHNGTAEQAVRYYSERKNDPRLPALAWDDEGGCIRIIPAETKPSAPSLPAELLQPGTYTRDPSRPSAHVRARVEKHSGESGGQP
jgi:hypothetical protein